MNINKFIRLINYILEGLFRPESEGAAIFSDFSNLMINNSNFENNQGKNNELIKSNEWRCNNSFLKFVIACK